MQIDSLRRSWRLRFAIICVIAAAGNSTAFPQEDKMATPAAAPAVSKRGYFPTSEFFESEFKREVSYLVSRITRHIVSMGEYAGSGNFSDPKSIDIIVKEWAVPGATIPQTEGQVRGGLIPEWIQFEVDWSAHFVWESSAYLRVATAALGSSVDAKPTGPVTAPDPAFIMSLTNILPESLEAADARVSAALQENFRDPVWHVRAALLLGAFSMRERAGVFQDVTEPLSQMCAHLAIAEALNGKPLEGAEAELASALMDTLCGREVAALPKIEKLRAYGEGYSHWANALKMRLTHDYRDFDSATWTTSLEGYVAVRAAAESVSDEFVFEWFRGELPPVMVIGGALPFDDLSVGAGNVLLQQNLLGLEVQDAREVYALTHGKAAPANAPLSALLNRFPKGSLEREGEKVQVDILNRGLWGMAAQRSILQSIVRMHYQLWCNLGLRPDAAEFSEMVQPITKGLILDPFIRLFIFADLAAYEKAVDDCFVYLQKTPEIVSPGLWQPLAFGPDKRITKPYVPKPHKDANSLDWRPLLPTFGTVENSFANSRLGAWFATQGPENLFPRLYAMAPHNRSVIVYYFRFLLKSGTMTPEGFDTLAGDLAEYDSSLLRSLQYLTEDHPELHAHILSKRAMIDVDAVKDYLDSHWYEITDERFDFLARLLLTKNRDAVKTSRAAPGIVGRYVKMGNLEQAKAWAEFGEQVYSYSGLQAKGKYQELTGDIPGAARTYRKATVRYNNPLAEHDLVAKMYAAGKTEDLPPDSEAMFKQVFPNGLIRIPLADRKGPPKSGVVFEKFPELARKNGILESDIILACNGIEIADQVQYRAARDSNSDPALLLTIYRDGEYIELSVVIPDKLWGEGFIPLRQQ